MVKFPKEFVAIKYPGYFWNLNEQKLYSIKISGMLHPLSGPYTPNVFNNFTTGYTVSVKGRKRIVDIEYLKNLKPADSVIPLERKK